ncbi:unnamed protein product [Diplocarpon coronariae]
MLANYQAALGAEGQSTKNQGGSLISSTFHHIKVSVQTRAEYIQQILPSQVRLKQHFCRAMVLLDYYAAAFFKHTPRAESIQVLIVHQHQSDVVLAGG